MIQKTPQQCFYLQILLKFYFQLFRGHSFIFLKKIFVIETVKCQCFDVLHISNTLKVKFALLNTDGE